MAMNTIIRPKKFFLKPNPGEGQEAAAEPASTESLDPAVAEPEAPATLPPVTPVPAEPPPAAMPTPPPPLRLAQPKAGPGQKMASRFAMKKKGAVSTFRPASGKGKPSAAGPAPAIEKKVDETAVVAKPVSVPPKPKSKIWGRIITVLLLVLICGGAGGAAYYAILTTNTMGRFGALQGRVTVTSASGKVTKQGMTGMRVLKGDTITVEGTDGRAYLLFGGSDIMQIGENTTVSLSQPKGFLGKVITCRAGTMGLEVPWMPMGASSVIITANATIKFGAAGFEVSCSDKSTTVDVGDAVVQVARTGDKTSVEVKRGYSLTVDEGSRMVPLAVLGGSRVKRLEVVEPSSGVAIDGFEAIMSGELMLDMNRTMGMVGIRADTEPDEVGSVKFQLNDERPAIVNDPPYIFRGKAGAGLGEGWKPSRGTYKLSVTSYSKKNAKGMPSAPRLVTFRVRGAKR